MAGEVPYLVLAEGRSGERQLGAALAVVQRPRGQRRRRRPAARRRSEAWKGGESAQRFEGRASSLPEGSSLRAEVPGIGIARWAPPVTVAIALANRARPGMKRRQRSRSGEDPHAASVAMASAGKSVFGQTAAGGQDTRGPCQASFSGTTCITSLCFGAKGW